MASLPPNDLRNLDTSHEFHDEVDAEGATVVRYGLSGASRNQALTALIELNQVRFESEQAVVPAAKPRASKGRAKAVPASQSALALGDVSATTSKTKAAAPAKNATKRSNR